MDLTSPPARIVLVEDDAAFARTARRVLNGIRGVVVETCHDVASARRAIARPFDVVVSDFHLPDGTGVDVLTAAATANGRAPRIVMTAHTEWDCATQAINEGGAYRVLSKPLSPDVLVDTVGSALATKRLRDEQDRSRAEERLATNLTMMSDREKLVRALSRAMDRRVAGEQPRVEAIAALGRSFARKLGLSDPTVSAIELTILTHRIGSIGLRDDASAALVPLLGAEILREAGFPTEITRGVADSAEHLEQDGPSVSIAARVLAICTRYLDLTTRECLDRDAACAALVHDETLDDELVAAFVVQPC